MMSKSEREAARAEARAVLDAGSDKQRNEKSR